MTACKGVVCCMCTKQERMLDHQFLLLDRLLRRVGVLRAVLTTEPGLLG